MRLTLLIFVVALSGATMPAFAQTNELPVGIWSGTSRNINARALAQGNAPQTRATNLTIRKAPDPHWRWRGGPKEMTVVTVGGPGLGGQGGTPVGNLLMSGDTLTYSFTAPGGDDEVRCRLVRQENRFEGTCQGGSVALAITLNPPAVEALPAGVPTEWQGLAAGTWRGTRSIGEGAGQPATLRIAPPVGEANANIPTLTLTVPQGPFEVRDATVKGDVLTFSYGAQAVGAGGVPTLCSLTRQADGRLEGTCRGRDGAEVILVFYPPGR